MRFSSFHPATTGVQGSAPSNIGTIANVTGTPSISATTSITKDGVVKVYLAGNWSAVADASSYDIEIDNGTTWVISSPGVSINNFELEVNPSSPLTYRIRVKAVNKNGFRSAAYSSYSNSIVASGDVTAPGIVTGVTAQSADFRSIILSWTNPTDSDLSYVEIQHSLDNSTFTVIGKITGTRFTHHKRTEGTTNYYRLRAVDNSSNASAYSSVVSVALPAIFYDTVPSNVSGTPSLSYTTAVLLDGTAISTLNGSWTPVSNAVSYKVEITNTTTSVSWIVYASDETIKNIPVVTGNSYNIKVKAINSVEISSPAWSTTSATVTAAGDVTGPGLPTSITAVTSDFRSVVVSWVNPTDKDFSYTEISHSLDNSSFTVVGKISGTTFTHIDRAVSTTNYYRLRSFDYSNNAGSYATVVSVTMPAVFYDSVPANVSGTPTLFTVSLISLDGTESSTLRGSWTAVSNAKSYDVEITDTTSTVSWIISTPDAGIKNVPVVTGRAYRIRVKAVNSVEIRSPDWSTTSATVTAGGDATAPAVATGVVAYGSSSSPKITINWIDPTDLDYSHVKIYGQAISSTFNPANVLTNYAPPGGVYEYAHGKAVRTDFYIWVATVDYSGNESSPVGAYVDIPQYNPGTSIAAASARKLSPDSSNLALSDVNSGLTDLALGELRYNTFTSSAANKPITYDNANGVLSMMSHVGPYGKQLAFADTDDLYMRFILNGTFGTWRKFWHDGNDGSGSGLDADLLDGVNGTSYARLDVGNVGNINLNSGADRSVTLGSSTNYNYQLITAGDHFQIREASDAAKVRLHIAYPNGNVGIGTTSPGKKLVVVGAPNATITSSDGIIADYGSSSTGVYTPIGFSWAQSTGTNAPYWGMAMVGTNYGSAQADLTFFTQASERMRILSTGNVGIGTTTPLAKLQVGEGSSLTNYQGSALGIMLPVGSGAWLELADNSTYGTAFRISQDSNTGIAFNSNGRDIGFRAAGYNNAISSSQVVLKQSGNFGVGTVNPLQKFVVSGGANGFEFVPGATSSLSILQVYDRVASSYGGMTLDVNSLNVRINGSGNAFSVSSGGAVTIAGNTVWHAGNDGSGSGLDADLLDGYQASDFTRKAEAATITGDWVFNNTIRFNQSGGSAFNITHDAGYIGWWNGAYNSRRSYIQHFGTSWLFHNESSASSIQFNTTGGGNVLINGSQIWHSGNDGSGSGLDANLLNGLTQPQLDARNMEVVSGRDFVNGTLITTNINYAVTNGDPFVLEISGNSYGQQLPHRSIYQGYIYNDTMINTGGISSGRYITGIVLMNVGGNLCFWFPRQGYWHGYSIRCYVPHAGTNAAPLNRVTAVTDVVKPSGTKEVDLNTYTAQAWHNLNDGAGSGLDADLLDGVNSDGFMQLAGVQTASGRKTFSSSAGTIAGDFYANSYVNSALEVFNGDGNRGAYMSFHITGIAGVKFGLNTNAWLATDATGIQVNGSTVWHAGNDGSTSGLDADLLDGLHGVSFAKTIDAAAWTTSPGNDANVARNLRWTNYGGNHVIFDASSSLSPSGTSINNTNPATTWTGTYPTLMGWNGSSTYGVRVEIARYAELHSSGNTLWHVGNDGTGSGLDADLLDGLDSNRFLSFAVAQSYPWTPGTAGATFVGGWHGTYGGTNQYMAFGSTTGALHWVIDGDYYAGDGVYKVWHAGNDGSGSGLDADLLDGYNSSEFARLNNDVTFASLTANRYYSTDNYTQSVLNPTMDMAAWFGASTTTLSGIVTDRFAFTPPTTATWSTDGTNFSSITIPTEIFKGMISNQWGGFDIPSTVQKVRFTWSPIGYIFIDNFVASCSTNGNSIRFIFEKSETGATWLPYYTSSWTSTWPGYITHKMNGTPSSSHPHFRVTIERTATNSNNVNIGGLSLMTDYGGSSPLYTWDAAKNFTLNSPGQFYVGSSKVWNAGDFTYSQSATAYTLAQRNSGGYLTANWFDSLAGGVFSSSSGVHLNLGSTGDGPLITTNSTVVRVRMYTTGGVDRASVYADNGNYHGFLDNAGNWTLQMSNSATAGTPAIRSLGTLGTIHNSVRNNQFDTVRGQMVGTYDPTNTQGIWAMGASYVLPAGGSSTNYGGHYGLAYSYNPDYGGVGNNPQSKPGLNHQLLIQMNGVTHTAIGSGIWTNGNITATGGSTITQNIMTTTGEGNGIRFWDGDYGYSIGMGSAGWGGRMSGDTTSDYNMYFKMRDGTNRGFVFKSGSSASTVVAGIDGAGNARFAGIVVSSVQGFQSATYDSGRNRIWSFANADSYGMSYFREGVDTFGMHFGSATLLSGSAHRFASTGDAYHSGALNLGAGLTVGGASQFNGTVNMASGTVYTSGGLIYSTNWWRSTGTTGWFNADYSTGIYCNTTGQVRTYNGGNFYSEGTITAVGTITGTEFYSGSGNYFRAGGTGGFYCQTYNGGWNMTDGTWIRSIADKGILTGGAIQGATVTATSDLRLKSDIQPLANFSEVIDATNVYSFIKDGIRQWGVIAQEVLNTPAALLVHEGGTVFHDGTPILTVDFAGFTYALLAEVKELRKRVAILERK